MQHLQSQVPREKLIDGAHAFSAFSQNLRTYLRSLMDEQQASEGAPFTVTKEHIDAFMQDMRASGSAAARS